MPGFPKVPRPIVHPNFDVGQFIPTRNIDGFLYERVVTNTYPRKKLWSRVATITKQIKVLDEHGKPLKNADGTTVTAPKEVDVRIFRLPTLPGNRQYSAAELSEHMSRDMSHYFKYGAKQGGLNGAGEDGGEYHFYYETDEDVRTGNPPKFQEILFKQDTGFKLTAGKVLGPAWGGGIKSHHEKDIAEFVGGAVKGKVSQPVYIPFVDTLEQPTATTFLATRPRKNAGDAVALPDTTGNDVYVGSIFYPNSRDLYKDIYDIHGQKPADHKLNKLGTKNKTFFLTALLQYPYPHIQPRARGKATANVPADTEAAYQAALKANAPPPLCRFRGLTEGLGPAILPSDFDLHSANWMVIAHFERNEDGSLARNPDGTLKTNPIDGTVGTLVNIDHAGSFRNMEDEIHIHSHRKHLFYTTAGKSAGSQPSNHIREVPRHLKINETFANDTHRIATQGGMREFIEETMDEVDHYYGDGNTETPLLKFAERMMKSQKDRDVLYSKRPGPERRAHIIKYLQDKIEARQQSMDELSIEIKLSLWAKAKKEGTVSPYTIDEIFQQNPEYFAKMNYDYMFQPHYHFRDETQRLKPFGKHIPLSIKAWHKSSLGGGLDEQVNTTVGAAIVDTMTRSLGHTGIDRTNYAITFYKSTAQNTIPENVTHIVIAKKQASTGLKRIFESDAPTIATKKADATNTLKRGEIAINYVGSETSGIKAMFVEEITTDNYHKIYSSRLPPDSDPAIILTDVLLRLYDDAGIPVPDNVLKDFQRLGRKMKVADPAFNHADMAELDGIVHTAGSDLLNFFNEFNNSYFKNDIYSPDRTIRIPNSSLMEYAETECRRLIKANGPGAIIELFPQRDGGTKIPSLVYAMILACKVNGWHYNDRTTVSTDPDFAPLIADPRTVALAATTLLSPKAAPARLLP
jgi:hypothetical protein